MSDTLFAPNQTEQSKLIRGFVLMEQQNIRTAKSSDGLIVMDGIFQRANKPNANGRIYPRPLLQREVDNYMPLCRERRSLGELDHPDSAVVQLANVSHLVTELNWDGDTVRGTLEVLSTPKGEILASLVEHNIKLGISSRGLGSTRRTNEGYDMVEDDFNLVCFDAVSNPSTNEAFINKRLQESVEYRQMMETNKWVLLDDILNQILEIE